jgi:acetolactate synthase-1/2/3 large subunit
MAVMRSVTKWAVQVPHLSRLADLVGQAIRKATSGRPGPVYVDIPIDVMFGEIEASEVRYLNTTSLPTRPAPTADAVSRVLELLHGAKRPVVMAGGGVLYAGAAAELLSFVERSGIPVVTNHKSRGVIPTDHRLWARGFATLAPASAKGLAPDVILVLGARFGIYTGGRRKSFLPIDAAIVQVDIEPADVGRIRDADLAIAADCGEMLRALNEADAGQAWADHSGWAEQLSAIGTASKMAFAEAASADSGPIHPYRLAKAVAEAIPRSSVVCLDGGESHSWIDMTAHTDGPGLWLGHGYVGSMGEGMALAVGAQVAHPDRRVVLFTGDGSVGFNFAEFDTMVRHKLPVVVVVNNDQLWGMSAHGQDLMYGPGKRMVSELGATRYDLAAAGFGCHAENVTDVRDLDAALARALASGLPACVNVMTDPAVIHPITQRFVGRFADRSDNVVRVPYADDLEA